jgi:ethanolamine utilization protein EutQ (cupin superfamily)
MPDEKHGYDEVEEQTYTRTIERLDHGSMIILAGRVVLSKRDHRFSAGDVTYIAKRRVPWGTRTSGTPALL